MQHPDRWSQEQKFFDDVEYRAGEVPSAVLDRYLHCRKPYHLSEFSFWVLGDIRGKRILELGCGDGVNAIILAAKGATVVGIDISPKAIELAREKARLHHLEHQVTFQAQPLEVFLEQNKNIKFDIICGFAVLHHLLPVLDSILKDLRSLSTAETRFVFTEPIALSPVMRRVRRALPIATNATPDERPLEESDLAVIESVLPGLQHQMFYLFLRVVNRIWDVQYEELPAVARAMYDMAAWCEQKILRVPVLGRLGAVVVLYTRPRDGR